MKKLIERTCNLVIHVGKELANEGKNELQTYEECNLVIHVAKELANGGEGLHYEDGHDPAQSGGHSPNSQQQQSGLPVHGFAVNSLTHSAQPDTSH